MSESPPRTPQGVAIARSVPLRGMQRTVAQRMAESRQTTAHVTATAEIDATVLLATLQRARERLSALSLTHLLVKAVALCLRHHPRMNATFLDDTIHELAEVNIAVALSLPTDDLQLVVIRAADTKPLAAIVAELGELRERAAAGKLGLPDVRGGTFTLSNYGMLRHVVWATPIIPPGQVGVLGVARAAPRPVAGADGAIALKPVMPLSLTYDHRVINGVPAGHFLDDLCDLILTDFLLSP